MPPIFSLDANSIAFDVASLMFLVALAYLALVLWGLHRNKVAQAHTHSVRYAEAPVDRPPGLDGIVAVDALSPSGRCGPAGSNAALLAEMGDR